MLVKKADVIPLEAIVRGYITGAISSPSCPSSWTQPFKGSAWSEYKKTQTVHGIPMPPGLLESSPFPEPIFTPSTKAEQGEHDENIHPLQARELIGSDLYDELSSAALELYKEASAHALQRGVILADTKFEFGLLPTDDGKKQLILIDEVLTPDSSRYWPAEGYEPGKSQPSFDKQYLRDWLVSKGFKKGLEKGLDGSSGWTIEESVVQGTQRRYEEVFEMISGHPL